MTNLARSISFFVILTFGIGLTAPYAQVQATNGSIKGDVTDPGGAVITGALVDAIELDTQVDHKTTTDDSGHFDFPSLQPGRYQVKIAKSGFATPSSKTSLSPSALPPL